MTIVGTRPELIKMSRVIATLDECFDHVLVHTGQNYDYTLNDVFFKDLGIRKPDYFLEAAGATAVETIANVIKTSDQVMAEVQPEAVLIYGDTNSGLACISAKRRKIPIFHFEAGNRCFDARVPEEINRKIIDHTSDVNFVLTEHARRYLLAEGFAADRIIKSGSHMEEVLDYARPGIEASDVLQRLGLERGRYFIVSAHREENVDSEHKLRELIRALNRLAQDHGVKVVVSTHPRTRNRLDKIANERISDEVSFLSPFGFLDYIRLQMDALCVVSDSGTIAEEASLLNIPAVTLRDAHERPEGQDAGAVVLSSVNADAVADAVRVALLTHRPDARGFVRVPDYEGGQVSSKVARVLSGYIDFVNRVVWAKSPASGHS
jgi:UDP-N-acetylglucosamine 2-epimerase (non-hydrolysing)